MQSGDVWDRVGRVLEAVERGVVKLGAALIMAVSPVVLVFVVWETAVEAMV